MKREFSTAEVAKILQLKFSRVQQWLARGHFHATSQKAKGSGSRNAFSRDDLYRAAIFAKLMSRGYSSEEASKYIRASVVTPEAQEKLKSGDYLSTERPRYLALITHTIEEEHEETALMVSSLYLKDSEAVRTMLTIHEYFGEMDNLLLLNLQKIMDEVDRRVHEVLG